MSSIDTEFVQKILDQIDMLSKAIKSAGEEGRKKLQDIKVEAVLGEIKLTPEGKVDVSAWSGRSEDEQNELFQRLSLVRDSLHAAAGLDGPSDPTHHMYAEYASNGLINVLALFSVLLITVLLYRIVSGWNEAIRPQCAPEKSVLRMVILLGALGGALHLLRSLVMFVGNRQLKRSWTLYYISMPITGAGLAPIVYMLMRVGVINPSGNTGGGSAVSNLNLITIYAFAALTGLFAKTALDKLGEVFSTLFRTAEPQPKDALGSEKPPRGTQSAAP